MDPALESRTLAVHDPTTGEIRSDSTAEIACRSLDTDHSEKSFFVRRLQRRR
jgi:adenine-specific DNA-methyltransferase